MSLVAFPLAGCEPQDDLHPFEHLVIRLSSCFSSLQADEVDPSVARALEEIGTTFAVDECTLVAHGEKGSTSVVRSWAAPPHVPCSDEDIAEMPWLVKRLARNAVVALTPATDVPHAGAMDRAQAERSGIAARLAVPIVVGTRVEYGLMIGSRRRQAEWGGPMIERLRLVGEILGGGLARLRQADAPAVPADGERRAVRSADAVSRRNDARSPAEITRIIGESAVLRHALARLEQVAPLDATVLLLGETGTGKELFARALHASSRHQRQKLVSVNCAVLPPGLIESELFGHERGAFTGAVSMRQGRFELADGGTIFLDEIGDLAPDMQAKILRVLQEREFERVGSSKTRGLDVRVIAATHADLETAVAEGRFRADLYYRLSVFPIRLPPLRERPEDIPQLVWFFLHRHQRGLSRQITNVPLAVMQALQDYDWPGNVRELENVIARAMIRSIDGTLELDDQLRCAGPLVTAAPLRTTECGETLDAVQRCHIERVLRECGGRINGANNAAVRLGLHPNTLRFRIKKLGVVPPGRPTTGAIPPSAARHG